MSDQTTICNGKTSNLPSLEVVKKPNRPIIEMENMNFILHQYYARQDFERCRKIIQTNYEFYVNPEYFNFVSGLIEKREGNYFEALKSFQKVINMNSKNLETYKEIGKTLYSMGRFKQSMGVFREAEKMSSRPDAEIFHYIGEILNRNVKEKQLQASSRLNEEVKEYFLKAIQHGRKLESYQYLAEIYRREREYGKAIEILESCLQISPDNTEILTDIGVLYLKVNDTQRAFDKFLEISGINDKCPRGLIAFGAILQSRNDVDGALGKYKKITGDEVECAELWNNIGLCFFKKKKLIVAISCLRKSVWLSPLNYNSLYNLSLIFITAQQYASAFHTLAAAINLRKDSAECYMLLGICLRNLEDSENAFTAFERASTLSDAQKNPLIHLNFALFCYESERIELAAEHFNNFIRVSQKIILPTEYKFHATKLKALLKNYENFTVSNSISKKILNINCGDGDQDNCPEINQNNSDFFDDQTSGNNNVDDCACACAPVEQNKSDEKIIFSKVNKNYNHKNLLQISVNKKNENFSKEIDSDSKMITTVSYEENDAMVGLNEK